MEIRPFRVAISQAKRNGLPAAALAEEIAFATNYRQKRLQAGVEITRWTGDSRTPDSSPHFAGVGKADVATQSTSVGK